MLRVRVTWSGPSAPLLSTFYFSPTTEDTGSATAAHVAVATFWFNIRNFISTAYSWVVQPQVDQIDLLGTLTGSFTAANSSANAGTDAGQLLPTQTQGQVRWTTGSFLNGRRVQGRTFIPGPTEGSNTAAGLPDPAMVTAVSNEAQTFANATVNPVVWSDHHEETPPFGASTAINGGFMVGAWRVLRSRR
jgi:hypothetical protein